MPDQSTHTPQTTTQPHPKGSDHDHHRDAEDSPPNRDRAATGTSTSDSDRADGADSGDSSGTARVRRTPQSTTVGLSERVADGPAPAVLNGADMAAARLWVALTADSDGALWVAVDGADIQEVADRITAACDVLYRRRSAP